MVASHDFDLDSPANECLGYLLVAGEGEHRRALRLYDGRIIIGSHPSCHLQICDSTVSRCHLEMIVTEKGLAIRDLSSTNGTWLDGHRVPAATVGVGDVVTIGHCEIVILALLEPRPPCAAPWARVHTGSGEEEENEIGVITSPSVLT